MTPTAGSAPQRYAYGCWRFDVHGRAVGSSAPMAARADPLLTAAMTVLAANKQARLAGVLATVGRMETVPGTAESVATRVSLWLDVRADSDDAVDRLVAEVARQARDRAERDGTRVDVRLVERGQR